MLKQRTKRILALLMSFSMIAGGTDVMPLAAVSGDQIVDSQIQSDVSDNVFLGEGFQVTFNLQDHWDGGYNATVKIENTGDTVIDNWTMNFDYQGGIASVWNAELVSSEAGNYVIKNVGWNQDIPVGQSVEFGINGKGTFTGLPTDYQLLGRICSLEKEDYSVDYQVSDNLGGSFNGSITITNNMDQPMEDWNLEFDLGRNIREIWNASIDSYQDGHYVIKNEGYNSVIPAKQSVTFGFSGSEGTAENVPENYNVLAYQEQYVVRFHVGDGAVTNVPAAQVLKKGAYAHIPEEPVKADNCFAGWYLDKEFTQEFDFNAMTIEKNTVLYAQWIDLIDTDGDELLNGLEDHYGTDRNNPDTDGDGLSDYVEVVLTGTDPLSAGVDENGLSDGEQDYDKDTLTNAYELEIGTDPASIDTDADELCDNEELQIGTDPLKSDTDGDGASDGAEIRVGTDPLVADTSFHLVEKSDFEDTVSPSVEIDLKGDQVDTLSIEPLTDDMMFPEEMPGYMGKAYKFTVDGTFDSAVISFEFDAASLPEGADPVIHYFNEEQQCLEPLKTVVEGNTASAEVKHFSTYILMNRRVFEESLEWTDTWDSENKFNGVEISLIIDDSGSMSWYDENNTRLLVAQNLVEKLPENSKIGIVKFENSTSILTPQLTTDRQAVKNFLTSDYFYSYGGTYMYTAINDAFSLNEASEENILKMMVVLSDGIAHDSWKHSSTIQQAYDHGVRIYTVGLGEGSSSYFNEYLKPLANQTGGEFYLADQADALTEIYDDINKKIDIETDSDLDGLPDYYEEHMVSFNGVKMNLDKNVSDTDGDGLTDGEEVEARLIYNADKTKVYVQGKVKSFADRQDSDNDSILDPDDAEPMNYNITDYTLSWAEGLSYSNLHDYEGKTLEQAIAMGAHIKNLGDEYQGYLKDAIIVKANDSGTGWQDEMVTDGGLGSVALKIIRNQGRDALIYSLRGTEPDNDWQNDFLTDGILGLGWSSCQSNRAFNEYKSIAHNRGIDYYITGHSLGGRLALDVTYKTYRANFWGGNIVPPVHVATYNGLGYNLFVYYTLNHYHINKYKNLLTNFYYWKDLVGQDLGCTGIFRRPGWNVELYCLNADGTYDRHPNNYSHWIWPDLTKHGIETFHNYYDIKYTPGYYQYWVK